MRIWLRMIVLFAFSLPLLAQAPRIRFAANGASLVPPSTPYSGIARGSVFLLAGTNLGPVEKQEQNVDEGPLAPTLAGVSVVVESGGVTTEAIPLWVKSNEIMAILRSSTPAGAATVKVKHGDAESAPYSIRVLEQGLGLATPDNTGLGIAAATLLSDESRISNRNAANPGERVVLKATGLGPDDQDETMPVEAAMDRSDLPLEVFFGNGVPAEVHFRGRSRYPGWDRIEVTIPEGVSGCYVALYAKNGAFVSNFVYLPIAKDGRECVDGVGGVPYSAPELADKEKPRIGSISLNRITTHTPALGGLLPAMSAINDSASGLFIEYTAGSFLEHGGIGAGGSPEIGSCTVIVALQGDTLNLSQRPEIVRFLNAGTPINVRTPAGGTLPMQFRSGIYTYTPLPPNTQFLPSAAGTFQFQGPGGPDIGPLNASLLSPPLTFRWTNRSAVGTTIDTSKPLELTWTGGPAEGYVTIIGGSPQTAPLALTTNFICNEKASAGKFTVPLEVISSMVATTPPTGPVPIPGGMLQLSAYGKPAFFSADRLDLGVLASAAAEVAILSYK